MEKQIAKAETLLGNPGSIKRTKFITTEDQTYALNEALREKTTLLLGIKGYYTNLPKSQAENGFIIEHYHNLWFHTNLHKSGQKRAFRESSVAYLSESLPR